MKPLSTPLWCFFAFLGRLKRLKAKLLLAFDGQDKKGRQGLQLSGRRTRPPPLQTRINAKILKILPEWIKLPISGWLPLADFNGAKTAAGCRGKPSADW